MDIIKNSETKNIKKGAILSGTAIKIIGVILMTMDHLHEMFISQGVPNWFIYFGRPVATLFIFLCAEGFYYTHSKRRYLLQLLAGFLFMTGMNHILSTVMPIREIALFNNIFSTLFMAAFYMWMVDLFRKGIKEKKAKFIFLALGGMFIPFIIGFLVLVALNASSYTAVTILSFIPNPISAEGGFILVIMGVLFYLLRKYRLAQAGLVLLMSAISWYTMRPDGSFQWLMAAAVIPILLYSGKRGRGGKYFFYIFYPVHIYLFYMIAWFLRS
jgi:hypothetical protein